MFLLPSMAFFRGNDAPLSLILGREAVSLSQDNIFYFLLLERVVD